MKRVAAQCGICGKTLTPEEIEIGTSLVCPRCDPKRQRKKKASQVPRAATGRDASRN